MNHASEENAPAPLVVTPADPNSKSSAISNLALFLSVVSIAAVAAFGFYAYGSQNSIKALQSQSQSLLTQSKQALAQMDTLRQEEIVQQAAFQTLKAEMQNAQTRLVELTGSKHWVLSEANYLVVMANERLRARDIPTAITQLEAAKERISVLGDPLLLGLQEALAKDIAMLNTELKIDKQALWEQLNALEPLIEKLSFKTLENQPLNPNPSVQVPDESLPWWQKGLLNSWQELKGLVRITREEEDPLPLAFSLQEKVEAKRAMQLMLEQAQWAVLQGDSKIYLSALQSLEKWAESYFNKSPERQILLSLLSQLKTQPVNSPLADISATLKALSSATRAGRER
jgi:uroporphyrin-3 C-methyltransferase